MKKLTILTLFYFVIHLTFSQSISGDKGAAPQKLASLVKGNSKIFGTVVDSVTNQAVPFATVALNDPSTNKPVNGTICDENGKFTLDKVDAGKYQLAISFIGYSNAIINLNVVANEDINLAKILLSPSVQVLKEVTVEGQRALFEEKVDRTVYNAEGDATNKGGDATDVLRKVPMLSVDMDGNVSLRGSSSIKVLINNRPSMIAASSVADALKQIPAEMIKSVEVITSPSARYDAEGSAGIINIITKKNTIEGFSLGLDASAGYRGSNLSLNGNYRQGKMGFNVGGFGRIGYNVNGSFTNRQETKGAQDFLSLQEADTRNNFSFGRYQFGWDYDINDKNYLSASVQFGLRNGSNYQDNLLTQTFVNDFLVGRERYDVDVKDLSNTWDVNLNYIHTFKKPQEELSILAQYSKNNRNNDFERMLLESDNDRSISTKNLNDSYNEEITLQADYQNPIAKNQMIELGVKQIMRQVNSDYSRFQARMGESFTPIVASEFDNVFNYDQNIYSGYLSYTLGFLESYSVKAGARYEYTTIAAALEDEDDRGIPSYGALVPSLNISKILKNGNTIKAAYNRRIQRPSIQFLNPNVQNPNPLQQTVGNPDLDPEYTNNFELSYNTFIKTVNVRLTGFVRNTNNSIESIRDVIADTVIRTSYGNIGKQNSYGSSVFLNVNLSNKLSLNGGGDVYYITLTNNNPDPIYSASNEGWTANFRAFANYTIGKGWGLQAFAFARLRQIQLQGEQGGFRMYSLSVKKDFNNNRGSIGIGAENFATPQMKIKNELYSPVISQTSTNVLNNMNFKINFSYKIGKISNGQPRRRTRSVSNDDLKEGDQGAIQGSQSTGQGGMSPQGGGGQPPVMVPGAGPGGPGRGPMPQRPQGQGPSQQGPGPNQRVESPQQLEDSTITEEPKLEEEKENESNTEQPESEN